MHITVFEKLECPLHVSLEAKTTQRKSESMAELVKSYFCCSVIVSLQVWLQILFRCPQNWLLHYYRTNTEHVKNPYIFEKLPGNYLQFLLYVCKPCMWCKVKITILNMVNWEKMEKYELLTTFYTRGMSCMCIDFFGEFFGENSVLFRKRTATWSINSMNFSFFRMCFTLLYTGYEKLWKLFQKLLVAEAVLKDEEIGVFSWLNKNLWC